MIRLLCDHSEEPFAIYVSEDNKVPQTLFDPVKRGLLTIRDVRHLGTSISPGVEKLEVSGSYRVLNLDQAADQRKVYQRVLEPQNGDCVRSCVATLVGCGYLDVPELDVHKPSEFWDVLMDFMEAVGYHMVYQPAATWSDLPNGTVLVSGVSPRDQEITHMVIYRDKRMWHDPHPSAAGILKVNAYWKMMPIDIGIPRRHHDLRILRHPTL